MMDNAILQALRARKSVRAFTEEPVTAEERAAILEAAFQAPTAGNQQLYTILDITDPALRATLADLCDHQPMITKAPLCLVFLADCRRWPRAYRAAGVDIREPGPGDLLLVQNETSCVPYAIRRAKAQGMAVALNPSPIDETLTPDVLALADVLFVNETEAGALTGADAQDADALLRALAARFPAAQLVLTLGEKGAAYQSGGARLYQRAYPVTAADTTAAGDTFTGFFLAAMARNLPPKTCLRCAALAAALAVSRPGAADSIPTGAQMKAFGEASGEDMQRL